jgi:hypothetical protein
VCVCVCVCVFVCVCQSVRRSPETAGLAVRELCEFGWLDLESCASVRVLSPPL